jgi:hypothetical protein
MEPVISPRGNEDDSWDIEKFPFIERPRRRPVCDGAGDRSVWEEAAISDPDRQPRNRNRLGVRVTIDGFDFERFCVR